MFASLDYLLRSRMGNCMCGRETLTINNRRFYFRNRLGEGGFSYVDLVEDARSHKDYALKRITCHSKEEERVAAREVELMKRFKHPNIVPLVESANIKVNQYSKTLDILSEVLIVMPYYSRGSVQDHIEKLSKRSEKIPEDQIWTMFLGICQAVKEFHSQNPPYAHRDIKPANVMIADDGSPILMDLGSADLARVDVSSAKISRQLQDEAAERCSMFYRAPELFNVETGSTVDERTDIWSLGCLLYALTFLESPFDKIYAQGGSIALATQSENIKFPENSGYTSAIHELILRLMKVNVAERPFIDNVIEIVEANYRKSQNQV
ncbi:serine/threonine-protein kinase 16-like [Saccostrea cucullata]|uniref:serine/threonine-protein kinase 16-like n=1 Tax=Saccostrea cuccullata TaxID=36930 RepID=UPI002ED2122A